MRILMRVARAQEIPQSRRDRARLSVQPRVVTCAQPLLKTPDRSVVVKHPLLGTIGGLDAATKPGDERGSNFINRTHPPILGTIVG